jgi:heat-inducible transcriptional repressor
MTDRQFKLLQAIIREFIESAEAVGSVNLVRKYRLNVSSATIRNEMAELMKQGYIEKPHTSAGRVPTTRGYKLFVDSVMDEIDELDVALAALIKEKLLTSRFNADELLYTALNSLYEITGNVSMALVDNRIYHAGLARIPTVPEFRQVQELCNLIEVLEDRLLLKKIFELEDTADNVRVLFGEDTDIAVFKHMTIIYSPIELYNQKEGYIGIIGPERMNYTKVIPAVEFVANNINNLVSGW